MARRKKSQEPMTIAQLEAKNSTEPKFGKGITVASGFDLGAKGALDTRSTVATIAERDAHVTGNRSYEGMMVFVEEDKKTYQLIDGVWKVFGFDAEQFEASVEDTLTSTNTTTALSANQGRILNEKITAQGEVVTEINEKVTNIETTVGEIQESIEGLGTELEAGLTELTTKVETLETDMSKAKSDITTLQTQVNTNTNNLTALEEALEEEITRATEAEAELDAKIDSEVGALQAADTALNTSIIETQTRVDKVASDLAAEVTSRSEADALLEEKINANTAAITKEVEDRKSEIARVEGLINSSTTDISAALDELKAKDTALEAQINAEATTRSEEDQKLAAAIAGVDTRVESLEAELESIELTWDRVNNKPFETLGSTLKVSDTNELNVKIDGDTLSQRADGTLEVKDGVFASAGHNHDDQYASKAHEENQEIHLTATEKVNVGKIPAMESDITALKSTVGAASQHHIVMTIAEMEVLENTNHGDICHVIETKKTYILDKKDIDGDGQNPEWIELADFNSLVTVDWSIINNKPFTTIGEGLAVEGDTIKVVADGSTVEIKDGKLSVVEGIYAPADHSHIVTWEDVINKPTVFEKNCAASEWTEEEELATLTINHGKNSTNLIVKVVGGDNTERLVAVEYIDANTVKIWSDEKETVTVTVFSYDFALANPTIHSAVVGQALVGQAIVGTK